MDLSVIRRAVAAVPFARTLRRRLIWALRAGVRATERPLGAVIQRARRLPLPTWLLVPLAHETSDTAVLERIIERTSAALARANAAGRRPAPGIRKLHEVALLRRARIALDRRDDREALRWFERAHDEVGPTPNTWTWKAVTLRRLGRLNESVEAGEQAAAHEPPWCPAIVHLGILYQQLGNRTKSVDNWKRLLAAPGATAAELRWAWIGLARARQFELSLAIADRMIEETSGQPQAYAQKAASLFELGRADEAQQIIDRLEASGGPDDLRAVAFFYGRTGRAKQAHEVLLALPVRRRGADTLLELIGALREDGHLRLALDVGNEAVAAFPEHAELRQARMLAEGVVKVFTGQRPALPPAASHRPSSGQPDSQGSTSPEAFANPEAFASPEQLGTVLHVVGRSAPYAGSGYAVRTQHTLLALRAVGVDAQAVTHLGFPWEDGYDAGDVEDVDGVPHYRLRIPADTVLPLPFDQRLTLNIDALTAVVETVRPSLLHASSDFRNGLLAVVAGERLGIPVIYEMRGFWEETWLANRGGQGADRDTYLLRRERELEIAQRAAHVFTLAPTMRDALIERGIPADKISLAPNAVDPADFPERERDDALARRLGFGDDEVIVGYLSSFVDYEGIDTLIAAIAQAREAGVNVRGLLVGDGIIRPELERQAAQLGMSEAIVFTGRVPHTHVAAYYSLFDVFVVPRTNARVCHLVSPLKPYEAMASRRAMVVSGTDVLKTIVDDHVTGRVFTPEDPADLARIIAELAADPDQRQRLGHAARTLVLDQYTWARNAERYRDVYGRMVTDMGKQ